MPDTANIIEAIKAGDANQVKALLNQQKSLLQQAKGPQGESLLSFAVENGQAEVAAVLLHQGADVNEILENGYTPLHLAAKNGNEDLIKLLLENKADINAVSPDGCTPMELAIKSGHDAAKWFSL